MNARRPLALFAALLTVAGPAVAEDLVVVSTGGDGVTKVGGRIVDYTGDGLVLELPGGRRQTFAADKVLSVKTQYDPKQMEADRAFGENDFARALALYREVRSAETRPWVQRQITARMVWCLRGLGQPEVAGEEFLLLIRSDPTTPYFDCIPLAWIPSQPSVPLERAAGQWLARDDMPAAVLLGASHLLPTAARADALARLKKLTSATDRRIARLALAQTWRAEVATVDEQRLAAWSHLIEAIPESPINLCTSSARIKAAGPGNRFVGSATVSKAGPYYVMGLARAHRREWEDAALALLHAPILFPRDRALAAQSLLDAGRSLERLDRTKKAARLYRELIETYPKARSAAEARGRLDEMAKE